jgi:hypothetical protein
VAGGHRRGGRHPRAGRPVRARRGGDQGGGAPRALHR